MSETKKPHHSIILDGLEHALIKRWIRKYHLHSLFDGHRRLTDEFRFTSEDYVLLHDPDPNVVLKLLEIALLESKQKMRQQPITDLSESELCYIEVPVKLMDYFHQLKEDRFSQSKAREIIAKAGVNGLL